MHDLRPPEGTTLATHATDHPHASPAAESAAVQHGADTPAFRLATIDDAPAILELLETAFERWPDFDIDVTPLAHLQWKMSSPVDGLLPHTLGILDGRVVVAAIRWASYVYVDGRVLTTSSGADQAVHPDYQGRGFSGLHRDARLKIEVFGELGMGTSSNHERLANSRRRRPESNRARQNLQSWILDFDRRGAFGTHYRSRGLPGLATALMGMAKPRSSGNTSADQPSGLTIAPISRFDERADRLWERAREQFDVARVRDARYLNWRYADPRSGPSQILGAFEADEDGDAAGGGRLVGYAVFRPSGDQALLADLFVDAGREDAAAALIRPGVTGMRNLGCRRVIGWFPGNHPLAATLAAEGFVDAGVGAEMSFHQLRGSDALVDLEWYRDPARRLHVTIGDHDFV